MFNETHHAGKFTQAITQNIGSGVAQSSRNGQVSPLGFRLEILHTPVVILHCIRYLTTSEQL